MKWKNWEILEQWINIGSWISQNNSDVSEINYLKWQKRGKNIWICSRSSGAINKVRIQVSLWRRKTFHLFSQNLNSLTCQSLNRHPKLAKPPRKGRKNILKLCWGKSVSEKEGFWKEETLRIQLWTFWAISGTFEMMQT